MRRLLVLLLCAILACPAGQGWAQSATVIRDPSGTYAPVSTVTPAGTEAGLYVRIISQPTGAGGTSSTFGAAFPSVGTAAGARDTAGNMQSLTLDAAGSGANLKVNCAVGCSGGPADESAFTFGTTAIFSGGVFQTTPTNNALLNLQAGVFQVTAQRALFVNLRNASGTELGISATPLRIDPTGTTTQPVSGTVTANQGGAPWSENVTQFGGNAVVTGTGAGGLGIPRVTVSSDSSISGSDSTTGSTALGAANATISVALAGQIGVAFQLQSGGTGVYTVTPQCSFDGGTLYNTNGYIQDPFTGVISTTATIASGQATTDYPVMCPQGTSHAQMKVTSYTSGTANWLARATATTWPSITWGIVTTGAPTYTTGQINGLSLTTAGALRTDSSGVTQPVSGTVTANQGGTWTVQPGNTANTTPWLMTIQQGGNTANVNVSNQLLVNCANCSGSGVSQTDEATWTAGASLFASGGGVYQTTATANPLANSQMGTFQVTANRALFVNLRDSSGGEVGRTNPLAVTDPVLGVSPGATGTLQKGPMVQGIVVGTPPVYVPGGVQPLSVTTLGALRTDSSGTLQPTLSQGTGSAGPQPFIFCDKSTAINTAASGYTQLVAPLGGRTVYVCGYTFVSTSALSVKFAYGTGSNCGTGTNDMTGAMAVAANGGVVNPVGSVPTLMTPTGQAFCVNLSAATQVSGHITYGQF